MNKAILPGSTIGVLGSGQLGRMFAIAARRMGYRVHVLSPDDDTPTGQVADVEIQSNYNDLEKVAQFARKVDVVTFEFENVPIDTINMVEKFAPVYPGAQVLHTTQHRVREKSFLSNAGLPVSPYLEINSLKDLKEASDDFFPCVLKSASWGYDGKGQQKISANSDLETVWADQKNAESVLEQFVDFQCELSVIAARATNGEIRCYDPILNLHHNHILDISFCPAGLSPQVSKQAKEIAEVIMNKLSVIGVLCVEFFLTHDEELLINELAPRPHNSGHLTIDAHSTCQFEQQVRTVCGLPLGSTEQQCPAAMANLLGDLWQAGEPNWVNALRTPKASLHLYGKKGPVVGRKMGHLTVQADNSRLAHELAISTRESLTPVQVTA